MTEQQINQLAQSIARRWADASPFPMQWEGWSRVMKASTLELFLGLPPESLRFEGGDVKPIAADRVLYLYRPSNPFTDVTIVGRGLRHTLLHVFENIARCLIEDGGAPHFPDNPALTGELVKSGGTEAAAVKPEDQNAADKVKAQEITWKILQRLAQLKPTGVSFSEALQEASGVRLNVSKTPEGQRVLRVAATHYKLGATYDLIADITERLAAWMVSHGRDLPAQDSSATQKEVVYSDDPKEEEALSFPPSSPGFNSMSIARAVLEAGTLSLGGYRTVAVQKKPSHAAIVTSKDQEMMQRDTAGAYAAEVSKKAAQELAAQKKPEPKPSPFTTVAPMNGRLGNPHVKWEA